MSAGQAIGAVAGFFMGGPFGAAAGMAGAFQGLMVGGMVQNLIDPPKGPHMEGPRLSDLTQQTSTYGATIPRLYGTTAVMGNVFWLENNALREVATTTSQGGGGKGGGGAATQTTYAYYGTFAVGICEGAVAGVRRIWVGASLLYDAGSSDIGAIQASNEAATFFKLYKGTDTQLADTRMQATLGVANTPAYRGVAYIVLYDMPLKDYGNSIAGAQIRVEVVKGGTNTPTLLKPGSLAMSTGLRETVLAVSGRYAYTAGNTDALVVFDIGNPAVPVKVGTINAGYGAIYNATGIYISGTHLFITSTSISKLAIFDISNPALPVFSGSVATGTNPRSVFIYAKYAYVANSGDGTFQVIDISNPALPIVISTTLVEASSQPYSVKIAGNYAYIASGYSTAGIGLHIYDVSNPILPVLVSSLNATMSQDIAVSGNYAYMIGGGGLQVIDVTNPAAPVIVGFTASGMSPYKVLISGDYACLMNIYGAQSLQVYDISAHGNPVKVAYYSGINDPRWLCLSGNDMLIVTSTGQSLESYIFAPVVIVPTLPALSSIVSAEMLKSSLLSSGDIDTSLLTRSVRGFAVSSVGAIRAALEPLQGAFPFDVVQHGYTLKCVPRGTAPVATIDITEMDARARGDAPGVQFARIREMDSVLPVRVSIKYLDADTEYNIGEQMAARLNTPAVNVRSMDLPVVFTATEAAGIAEVLLYLYWLERYDLGFTLPPVYNRLEAADVITINAGGTLHELRLTNINYTSGGWLECAAKYNKTSLYTPAAQGAAAQSTGMTLSAAGLTRYLLLDIPLLLDSQNMAGFPVAMCGYLSGWPGGVLYRSDDAGQTWGTVQGFVKPGTVIGYAGAALAAHDGRMIDKASVLAANLLSGALYSTTEALMLSGGNQFAYGADGRWEIIAAQNCIVQSDGSYLLSDLLRGRHGTEWASGLHVTGDALVALTSASMAFVSANLNQIGLSRTYRGITVGQTLDTDVNLNWTYRGVNLECLSPVELNGNRHPATNDWTLT